MIDIGSKENKVDCAEKDITKFVRCFRQLYLVKIWLIKTS